MNCRRCGFPIRNDNCPVCWPPSPPPKFEHTLSMANRLPVGWVCVWDAPARIVQVYYESGSWWDPVRYGDERGLTEQDVLGVIGGRGRYQVCENEETAKELAASLETEWARYDAREAM